jgi:hypothetical protein
MWTREIIDEIIMGQVNSTIVVMIFEFIILTIMQLILSLHSSCWLDSTQPPQLCLVPVSSWPEIQIFKKSYTKASSQKWQNT